MTGWTDGVSMRGGKKTGPLCLFIAFVCFRAREFKKLLLYVHKVTSDGCILFIYLVFLCVLSY